MYSDLFSASSVQDLMAVLPSLPYAIWETFYVTVLSTLLSLVLGLPLGVLLVAGEKNGVLPLPRWLLQVLNVIINLLRSVPFLILMIMVFPLSRLIIGTAVGTTATIVPLVVAAFPFVARLVESSLREVDPNIIEAAQSMANNKALTVLTWQNSLKVLQTEPTKQVPKTLHIAGTDRPRHFPQPPHYSSAVK